MYKAWVTLDFGKPKDAFQNFYTNQYHDPSYGFNLEDTLRRYAIKEMDDPAKRAKLVFALKQGDLSPVAVVKGGKEWNLRLEAVPRYRNINLYNEKGQREKREQFDMTLSNDTVKALSHGKGKDQQQGENRGMSR